jgi:pilus assembly protein CpaB
VKTRLLGGIAALVVAIIGTVMLLIYVQGADRRALANTETEEVYIVQKEIPAGTGVDKFGDNVVKKAVPRSAIATDSVKNLSDLGNKVSSIEFMPGEQILASRMVDPSSLLGRGRVEVPTGLQEVTVKLDIERVVGGNIEAGDTVGVLLSFKPKPSRMPQALLRNPPRSRTRLQVTVRSSPIRMPQRGVRTWSPWPVRRPTLRRSSSRSSSAQST